MPNPFGFFFSQTSVAVLNRPPACRTKHDTLCSLLCRDKAIAGSRISNCCIATKQRTLHAFLGNVAGGHSRPRLVARRSGNEVCVEKPASSVLYRTHVYIMGAVSWSSSAFVMYVFPCLLQLFRARACILYIMYVEQKSLPLPKKCCVCFAGCENCRTFASANEPDRPLGTGRALMRSLQGARSLRDLHRQRL